MNSVQVKKIAYPKLGIERIVVTQDNFSLVVTDKGGKRSVDFFESVYGESRRVMLTTRTNALKQALLSYV